MVRLDVTCDATTVYVVIVHFKGTSWTIETIGLSKDQKDTKSSSFIMFEESLWPKEKQTYISRGKTLPQRWTEVKNVWKLVFSWAWLMVLKNVFCLENSNVKGWIFQF